MDKPILFSSPMILAILREIEAPGTGKTQTRRIIKPQPHGRISMLTSFNHGRMEIAFGPDTKAKDGGPKWWRPLAQAGDRLWCREAHYLTDSGHELYAVYAEDSASVAEHLDAIRQMRADLKLSDAWAAPHLKRRPSIHMPRWASRLTLYVTDVRVERLQEISEEDARAEGVTDGGCLRCGEAEPCGCADPSPSARDAFAALWFQINGEQSWAENPWVAAYTFRPALGNIDSLPASFEVAA